jgi:hypothetical protein
VLEPASLKLPASIRRVSILPLPGAPSKPGVIDSLRLAKLGPDTKFREIKMGYLHGICDVFSTSPRFQKVAITDSLSTLITETGRLFWEDMVKVCTHDTTDIILVLNRTLSRDFYEYLFVTNLMDYYANDYTMLNFTKWTFYDPGKQREVARFNFTDTIVLTGGFSSSELERLLYETFYSVGERIGNRLVPHWKNASRLYFTGPGKNLKDAAGFIDKNHWYKATRLWNEQSEGSNQKKASRAAFNMALAFERDDMLDQALLWITYSDSLLHNENTESYKKILEERMSAIEELDQQLNAE